MIISGLLQNFRIFTRSLLLSVFFVCLFVFAVLVFLCYAAELFGVSYFSVLQILLDTNYLLSGESFVLVLFY